MQGKYRPGYEWLEVPCGTCLGCRLDRARSWAVRCAHEAQLHDENAFITLTYAPEHLPKDHSLDVKHFQDFMKRLRRSEYGRQIRFFHCGEYGEKTSRPHYHACLFGIDFDDKEVVSVNKQGQPLHKSAKLSKLWPWGHSSVGTVTFQSAGYCARYITKKITGEAAESHYEWVDQETGEIHKLKPEYTTMSRRPGLGKEWFERFKSDVYPHDYVVIDGKKHPPPRYYDKLLEEDDPAMFERVKNARIERANSRPVEWREREESTDRRRQRDECLHARASRFLSRDLETA